MLRPTSFRGLLAAGFAAAITIAVIALGSVVLLHQWTTSVREKTLSSYVRDLLRASDVELDAERIVASGRAYLLTRDREFLRKVEAAEQRMFRSIASLENTATTPRGPRHLERITSAARLYTEELHRLVDQSANDPLAPGTVEALEVRLLPRREALAAEVRAFVVYKEELLSTGRETAEEDAADTRALTVFIGVAGVGLAAALAWLTTRRLDQLYEMEREATRRALEASRARDELLGVVAHDLRNPIHSIVMKTAVLGRQHAADRGLATALGSIRNVALRMEYLVKNLLDGASIDAGRFQVHCTECRAEDIVDGVFEMLAPIAESRRIELHCDVDPELTVWADEERLIEVLSNLIGNALKFTPEGGRVEVSAHNGSSAAEFVVRDTGPGVPAEAVPHVFERFWHGATSRRAGTGLGLYIAKGIVEAHGGRIWVQAGEPNGSAFHVELPSMVRPGGIVATQPSA